MGNVVESQLNQSPNRCGYLWTLPMFHVMGEHQTQAISSISDISAGWTFPWAITAVRGTHYCLCKIDYPLIWHMLRTEPITYFCAAPTVNTLLCRSEGAVRLP